MSNQRKQQKLRRKGKKGGPNTPSMNRIIPHPKQINGYEITHNKTLRFTVPAAATSQPITYQNLLDTILFTTTAVVPFDLFFAVRTRRVKVWSMPAIGSTNSASVVFDGATAGSVGDRTVHTDTSMGIEPAFVSAKPSPRSLAANFQVSSNNVAFHITCGPGSVVDVDLSFRSDTLANPVQAQNASVAAVVGVVAYRGLDGLAKVTTNFLPEAGVNTI